MLTVKKNDISITKGDTMPLHVDILDGDNPYVPAEGDSCRFALSIGYKGNRDYVLILEKAIPLDSGDFIISAEETEALNYTTYNYDVELVFSNGYVDTFISGTLTVEGECK